MTESAWTVCMNPDAMLSIASGRRSNCCGCRWANNGNDTFSMLPGEQCCLRCDKLLDGYTRFASDRKLRLLSVAFSKTIIHILEEASRGPVRNADCREELTKNLETILWVENNDGAAPPLEKGEREDNPYWPGCLRRGKWSSMRSAAFRDNAAEQAALIRDIVGNPFRPVMPVECSCLTWNDGAVLKIAKGIYEERAFDRMPILADALEDSGCADAAILAHCRSSGPHVRGCWTLDVLFGRE
jgi:hypothetical protein